MSVLRVTVFATTICVSTLAVIFVSADRLTLSRVESVPVHQAALPAPASKVSGPVDEPTVTGTVRQDSAKAASLPARAPNGFDTERLNALLRDASLGSSRKR